MDDEPFIELHYGPYECHGVIRHKIQRLHGISEQLTKLGYAIEYIPSIHLNRLSVVMKEREIFRCDIRNLLFNMHYVDDKVGRRLVRAVEEARKRMYSENNVPMYDAVAEGMRLLQKERDTGDLRQLLGSDTKVLFEIPLAYSPKKQSSKSADNKHDVTDAVLDESHPESGATFSKDDREREICPVTFEL